MIAIISGVAVYLWSYIPVKKKEVIKGAPPQKKPYPEAQSVDLEDILMRLPKDTPKKTAKPEPEVIEEDEPPVQIVEEKVIDTLALQAFENELGKTKNLIPPEKNKSFWNGEGFWDFVPPRERSRKLYKKTKNPKYRMWVPTQDGFKKRFLKYTDREGLKDYNEKRILLASINNFLEKISPEKRAAFVNKYLLRTPVRKLGLSRVQDLYDGIGGVLQKIEPDKQEVYYKKLYRFALNNPNDGLKLLRYETNILDSVHLLQRPDFIVRVNKEYNNYYNNNLNTLTNVTDKFIPYLKKIDTTKQALALSIFYDLYRKNNKENIKQRKRIDKEYVRALNDFEQQYQNRLRQAQIEYDTKLSKKRTFREISYEAIGGGFVIVLIITLILLILSMIRNLNRLSEAILENNKLFADKLNKPEDKDNENEPAEKKDLFDKNDITEI